MFCLLSPDRLVAERRSRGRTKLQVTLFLSNAIDNSEETEEGEIIMGSVSEFVYAMAALGILRAWNAREDERKC